MPRSTSVHGSSVETDVISSGALLQKFSHSVRRPHFILFLIVFFGLVWDEVMNPNYCPQRVKKKVKFREESSTLCVGWVLLWKTRNTSGVENRILIATMCPNTQWNTFVWQVYKERGESVRRYSMLSIDTVIHHTTCQTYRKQKYIHSSPTQFRIMQDKLFYEDYSGSQMKCNW